MRVLKFALIVFTAGAATLILAISARAGLEAAGVNLADWADVVYPATSMVLIVWLFAWLIRRQAPVPVGRVGAITMLVAVFLFLICQVTLSIIVFGPMREAGERLNHLSLGALMASALVSSHVWTVHRAIRAAERGE